MEDEAVAARLPTFPSLKSSMYRSRRSRLPTLPMSQEDARIEGRWQKTLSGEQLFQREQAATEVTIQQLEAGGIRKAKRRKVVQREEKIKSIELTTGERNIDSYISAIRHCCCF